MPTNKSNVFVLADTTVKIEGFCFAVEQIISAPNDTDSKFGGSLAIQNNQIVIGSTNTPLNNQYGKGVVYLYALDSSIASQKIIPLEDLTFSTSAIMINNWVIQPLTATLSGLINAINNTSGFTGISASSDNLNLILSISQNLQTSGIGTLGE